MKKYTVLAVLVCAASLVSAQSAPDGQKVPGTGASTNVSLLNINSYATYFYDNNKQLDIDYEMAVADDDFYDKVAALGGKSQTLVDTPLEIALLSTCAGVVDVRPVEANKIIGNAKQADLKVGAAVFQEIQVLRFLGNTAAVGRHEGVLKFITDRGNVSRGEVESYYRQGIGQLIAGAVDEEFNKVSFFLDKTVQTSYNAVLTRNPQNRNEFYTLSYEDAKYVTKKLSATSLDDLLTKMQNEKTQNVPDFSQTSLDQVRAKAALVPAVIYAGWKSNGVAGGADALALIKEALTNFYIDPSKNYLPVLEIAVRYAVTVRENSQSNKFAVLAYETYHNLLRTLNSELYATVSRDVSSNLGLAQRAPSKAGFIVFSTPYE